MISMLYKIYKDYTSTEENSKEKYETNLLQICEEHQIRCEMYAEEQKKLHKKDAPVNASEIKDTKCFVRTGVITTLEQNHGVIDSIYCFDISAANCVQGLEVNCVVSYLAYKHSDDVQVKVIKIKSIERETWCGDSTNDQIDALVQELKESKPECFTIHERNILGIVVGRRGHLLTVETNTNQKTVTVDLDTVITQFLPSIGDRLVLQCNVQSDASFVDMAGEILEVTAIHSSRNKQATGTITFIDDTQRYGDVDRKYFFLFDALSVDYIKPNVGDKVAADLIEYEQGKYDWRAIKVVLVEMAKNVSSPYANRTLNVPSKPIDRPLTEDKNGIFLTDNLVFNFTRLNEKAQLTLTVHNRSSRKHKILRSCFMITKVYSQLRLISPKLNDSFEILPGERVDYEIEATAKSFGTSTETFCVTFSGTFKIARLIEIKVEDLEHVHPSIGTGANIHRNMLYTKDMWKQKYDIIPGARLGRKPNFIAERFASFNVPRMLKETVLSMYTRNEISISVDRMLPCLTDPLSIKNYAQCFHNLLYLEEIAMFHNMRRYDRERAHFDKEGPYLSLKIENLAETRPSLVLGDTVQASNPCASDNEKQCFEGCIHKTLHNRVLLKFSPNFHDKYNGEDYKLEFFFSRMSLRKMHHAIDKVSSNLGADLLFPTQVRVQPVQLDCSLVDGELTDCNHKTIPWFDQNLNEIQKIAVKNILQGEARPIPYVIFGPPGTGKTITLIETILQICTQIKGSRIVVGTPSNSAANLLTERLMNSKALKPGDFIRLVGYNQVERESIPENILEYCATCDLSLENTAKEDMITTESGLKLSCNAAFLGRHRITIATCTMLGTLIQMKFPTDHFTHVVVDEVGQCTEPEVLIPITLLSRQQNAQIIFAGDPMQLGPVVMSNHAKERGLSGSLLTRLLERFPYQRDLQRFNKGFDPRLVTKLVYSYRALPSILKLYSKLFYCDELLPMVSATESPELTFLSRFNPLLPTEKSSEFGVVFNGIRGENQQSTDSPSWMNAAEAKSLFFFILKLYKMGATEDDIGVITPYQQQVKVIRNMLNDSNVKVPKVGTVEEFQGQERNIILLSTVRSSASVISQDHKHGLGFVQSSKRMNVAISRAKSLLVIFGNPHLLVQDHCWKVLLKYCVKNNSYFGCDLPNLQNNYQESNDKLDTEENEYDDD